MENQNDHDTYVIPPNFVDTGTFFGGMFKARNVAEAGILAAGVGIPVFLLVPAGLTVRLIVLCLTSLPLGLLALIGISGESLSSFLLLFLKYMRNRRVVGGEGQEEAAGNRNGMPGKGAWGKSRKGFSGERKGKAARRQPRRGREADWEEFGEADRRPGSKQTGKAGQKQSKKPSGGGSSKSGLGTRGGAGHGIRQNQKTKQKPLEDEFRPDRSVSHEKRNGTGSAGWRRAGEEDFPAEFDQVKGYELRQKLCSRQKPRGRQEPCRAKEKEASGKICGQRARSYDENLPRQRGVEDFGGPKNSQGNRHKFSKPPGLQDQMPLYRNPVAAYLPIVKVENGIIYTRDRRYVKVVEVVPINFLLRSAREQRSIIYSFVSYLKISPVKLQFKVLTRRAEIGRHINTVRREMAQETNRQCRMMQEDYLQFVQQISAREAVTRRFFLIFEYEPWDARHGDRETEAVSELQNVAHTASTYLRQCGNEVFIPENEDAFTVEVLYHLLCRNESAEKPFSQKVREVLAQYGNPVENAGNSGVLWAAGECAWQDAAGSNGGLWDVKDSSGLGASGNGFGNGAVEDDLGKGVAGKCVWQESAENSRKTLEEDSFHGGIIPSAEFFAPQSIDFTHGSYVCIDGLYYTYLLVPSDGYRTQVPAGWLSLLVNAGDGIDLDMFLSRQPKEQIIQKVGQQLRINRSRIKDASDTNTDFDDIDSAIRSGYYLKEGLAGSEDFYYMNLLVTVTAPTVEDLEWKAGEMKKLLLSQDMRADACRFRQEQAFLSSLPLVSMEKKLYERSKRNLLTGGAAGCYPFTSYEMCDDNGILLGVNKYNSSLIIVDIFNSAVYKNANMAILGTSGAGKTFTMQLMALRMRRKGIPVFIIAPLKGHEFHRACANVGGEFIQVSPASPHCINVMEIRQVDRSVSRILDGPGIQLSELAEKIQRLHVFFSLLIPDMSHEERQLLDEALIHTYNKKGITHDNASLADPQNPEQYREMPVLGDLYEILKKSAATKRLANILKRLVNGSASTFNQQTNVSLENKYTVLDISSLTGDLLTAGMFVALDFVWDRAKEDRTEEKAVFIDECWQLLSGAGETGTRLAGDFVLEIFKTIRGYGGSAVCASQDLNDFFLLDGGRFGKGIINNSKTKIILNLEDEEAARVQEVLHLSDAEVMEITHFERGSGLISTNSNNVMVEFKASPLEKDLITTDRRELKNLVERMRQGDAGEQESISGQFWKEAGG